MGFEYKVTVLSFLFTTFFISIFFHTVPGLQKTEIHVMNLPKSVQVSEVKRQRCKKKEKEKGVFICIVLWSPQKRPCILWLTFGSHRICKIKYLFVKWKCYMLLKESWGWIKKIQIFDDPPEDHLIYTCASERVAHTKIMDQTRTTSVRAAPWRQKRTLK